MGVSRPSLHEIAALAAGKDQTLVRLRSGEVLGWGGAGSGRMSPLYADICSPSRNRDAEAVYITRTARYIDISAGCGVSLGISDAGQPMVWGFCQVGPGGTNRFTEEPSLVDGIVDAAKVIAGHVLHAAIDRYGRVYTWGMATDGALGRASLERNARPGTVTLPATRQVAMGDDFMLALTTDGHLYGWGSNSAGQLGLGHLDTASTPQPIAFQPRVKAIATGSTHALGLTVAGKVFGWGSNHFGQVSFKHGRPGDEQGFITRPVPIDLPENIVAVAAGMHYSVALGASGRVHTWGWNGFGQLGHGDVLPRTRPTVIADLSDVREIAASEAHVIATGKSHLLGWGCNESGQLGGAKARQMVPTPLLAIAGTDRDTPN